MTKWAQRAVVIVLSAAAVFGLAACGGASSGDSRADALCDMLTDDKRVAPDQLARRVYGDGQFAVAAAGIRNACVEDHGAIAVYLDQTANYDGSYELIQPPGYGTETQ